MNVREMREFLERFDDDFELLLNVDYESGAWSGVLSLDNVEVNEEYAYIEFKG